MPRQSESKIEASGAARSWLDRLSPDLPVPALIALYERAFAALWDRAYPILGEISLYAIAERSLGSATQRHPVLAAVRLEPSGYSLKGLRSRAQADDPTDLRRALGALLAELMGTIDELTSGVLTPALACELEAAAPAAPRREKRSAPRRRPSHED